MKEAKYKIKELDCPEEAALLRKVLAPVRGIHSLEFEILNSQMRVEYDPTLIDSNEILSLIHSTGMKATRWGEKNEPREGLCQRYGRTLFLILSGLFLVLGLSVHRDFYLGSIFFGVTFVVPKAFFSLRRAHLDINLLMILAVIGALVIQEWFEASSVAFLFSLALFLEQWSLDKARKAIHQLLDLAPRQARVIHPLTGVLEECDIQAVKVGELLQIKPGEKIPLDGVVVRGSSSVNQAPITGESIPVTKEEGDEVFAGTLNEAGALECRVTREASETTLAHMIKLVEEARMKRSESEQWVDTFARYYTPAMLALSILVMIAFPLLFHAAWIPWIYRGLVILVIACPCALVISTPVTIISGLTAAARAGILIKGGIYLELVGKLKALALDKTGTLTVGNPEVQKILPLHGHSEKEILERAAALEYRSEHPLARAILRKAEEEGIQSVPATNFQAVKGKGAMATHNGKLYWIGSHRLMHEMGQETEAIHRKALELEDEGHTMIALGNDIHVCGLIGIADSPKKWVKETLAAIKEVGIKETVMLTGDNEPTAKALATYAGIDTYYSELLPEEKVDAIRSLIEKWGSVGMVGDGMNDAPAMAAATVGFAMGKMGADVAIETADICLMSDDLSKLPWLIRHSRRVLKVLKQNIGFSLAVKLIFFALALMNFASLWMAITADTGATLLVIFNALRLLKSNSHISAF